MSYDQQLPNGLTRRQLLKGAFLGSTGLAAAYLLGCSDGGNGGSSPTATAPLPSAVAGTPAPPDVLEWRSLAPAGALPAGRQDHSLVSDGEHLYLLGGQDAAPMGDLWAYDVSGDAWSQLASDAGPAPRFGHNAIWHNETSRMIVFGGQGSGGAFFNDVWAYDPASGAWSQLASAGPSPRYGAAGTLDTDGALVITHGFTDQGRFDDTWRYDIVNETWTDISPDGRRPVERCLTRACFTRVMDKHLLMFGGQTTETPYLDDLWGLLLGRGWANLERNPKPAARNRYSMVYDEARDKLTLIGGNGAAGPLNDVWWFDATDEFWAMPRVVGTPPLHRFGHDAAWVSSSASVLVFGGTAGGSKVNELWELATSSEP
ncbi:MAG: kelch repeat-containing protein [Dehalococcoidia bacterium]